MFRFYDELIAPQKIDTITVWISQYGGIFDLVNDLGICMEMNKFDSLHS